MLMFIIQNHKYILIGSFVNRKKETKTIFCDVVI